MNNSLRELAVVEYGASPKEIRVDFTTPFKIYGTGGCVGYAKDFLFEGPLIVVARKGTLDNLFYSEKNCWVIDTGYAVIPKQDVNAKWLYYQLSNFDLKKLNEATGVPSISRDLLYRIKFHKASPSEQNKIAKILSTADAVIEKTQVALAKYKAIKQGLLQDLFIRGIDITTGKLRPRHEDAPELYKESKLGLIPNEWEEKEFKELIKSIDSGWSPNCLVEPATTGEWGSLKTTSVTWDGYNPNENKKLPANVLPLEEIQVDFDDILITRVGPRERVGVVVHVNDPRKKLMLSDNMLRFKIVKDQNIFLPFLALSLGSRYVQSEWQKRISGLAEAQVVINQQIIRKTIILFPKSQEQQAIYERANNIMSKIKIEQLYLDKLQQIKQGLMSDLLGGRKIVKVPGELVTQNEN